MIYYIYDDSGNVLGFKYNGLLYYYQKNYQNDIIGIYDSNYNLVVTYKYDAWGKVISVIDTTTNNIGTINPFRYRSYYYDEETKLYYLNSRYYNPEWCRFINADRYLKVSILGNNLYIYTENNPISNIDISGDKFSDIGNFFKGCYNKTKKIVVDTYNNCKNFVNFVTKEVTKSIENGFNYLKDHFVARGGSGSGLAIGQKVVNSNVGAIDTESKVLEYKQKQFNEYLEINTEIALGYFTVGSRETSNLEELSYYIGIGPVVISDTGTTIALTVKNSSFLFFGAYIEIGFEIDL